MCPARCYRRGLPVRRRINCKPSDETNGARREWRNSSTCLTRHLTATHCHNPPTDVIAFEVKRSRGRILNNNYAALLDHYGLRSTLWRIRG